MPVRLNLRLLRNTCPQPQPGGMFFVLCFFAFTSLTTMDLLMMERKMVLREVRGEQVEPVGGWVCEQMGGCRATDEGKYPSRSCMALQRAACRAGVGSCCPG